MSRRLLAIASSLLLLAQGGCGYSVVRYGSGLGDARRVAIRGLTNDSFEPGVESLVSEALSHEFLRRGALRLVDTPETADLVISFNKFADSALNILVVHWWNATDFKEYLAGMQELNLLIKERFDAEGISFAFPTQTVYMKQDSEWRLKTESVPPAAT